MFDANGYGNCYPNQIRTSAADIQDAVNDFKAVFQTLTDLGLEDELYDGICEQLRWSSNAFRCFDKPKPPATKEQAIERYTTEYPPETICAPLKQNSPFWCTPIDTPPATKEQAIERYASEYSPEAICEPLKYNSPFQCTRTVEAPMVTRMSLSLATAQAVFALVGVLFVSVLRKIKKSDQAPKTGCDDELHTLVQKHDELIQSLLKNSRDHQA